MDTAFNICSVCNGSMTDPRIFPCEHSFCLKCLESSAISKESTKCPTCQIDFEISENLSKELKKNEFIKHIDSSSSLIFQDKMSEIEQNKNLDIAICEDHAEEKTLFCFDCDIYFCSHCLVLSHDGHKMTHISKYFDRMKKKVYGDKARNEDILSVVINNLEKVKNSKKCDLLNASKLKKEIEQKRKDTKQMIDLIMDELKKNVDEKFEKHIKRADDVLSKLENMETCKLAQNKLLKQQINDLNEQKFVGTSLLGETIEDVPEYNREFELSISHCKIAKNKIKEIFVNINTATIQFTAKNISRKIGGYQSIPFIVGTIPWHISISIYPHNSRPGKKVKFCLICDNTSRPKPWKYRANVVLRAINQENGISESLDKKLYDYGFCFLYDIDLSDLHDRGYVKNDSVTFEVYMNLVAK